MKRTLVYSRKYRKWIATYNRYVFTSPHVKDCIQWLIKATCTM